MPNVKFNLKKDNPKLIILTMHIQGRRFTFYTGLKIDEKYWNKTNYRVRKVAKVDHVNYNHLLDLLETEAMKAYRGYLVLRNQGEVGTTFQDFKDHMRKSLMPVVGKTFDEDTHSNFFDYVKAFIDKRSKLPEFAKGTITIYNTVLKHLIQFNNKWHRNVNWQNMDLNFAADFQNYLFNEKQFKPNYVNKIIQQLRNFINAASEEGIEVNPAYKSRRFQVSKEEVKNIYLDVDELKEMYSLDLSPTPGLSNARDLFIVGAFTGLRYSDFSKLNTKHFVVFEGVEVIKVTTTKTKTEVTIPIHPYVKEILERNGGKPPYYITNQKLNDHLKVIAQKCEGWKDKQGISGPKHKEVSTHTARRSFATNAFLAGVPVISIMKITGHRTEKQFMKYIAISGDVNAKIISSHNFFKEHLRIVN